MKNPLLQTSCEYDEMLCAWEQTRAAIHGKNKVVKIIKQLPNPLYNDYSGCLKNKDTNAQNLYTNQQLMNQKRLEAYWSRGRYFNATGRTHTSLNGMLWSKPPEHDLSTRTKYLEENANGGGVSLNDFVRDLSSEDLEVGRYGVLVDMPEINGRPTVEQVEQGFSARFVGYKAESIYYYRLNEKTNKLDEVRLFEFKQCICDDGINYESKRHIRRLILIDGVYTNEMYNEDCKLENSVQPKANGNTLDYIPFQFFGASSNSPEYDNPPLYDLGQTNLGHFVLDCDNRDNLHYHGQGMTNVFTSMDVTDFNRKNPAGLDVGAKGRNMFEQGDKVEVLQIEATGAIATEMERDEKRMTALGAQLVQDVNSNVTLGAKELEFGASVSELKQISYNISEGITQCIRWADLFMGGTGEGSYKQNTDFVTDNLSPEMLNHFFTAVQAGVAPIDIYYEALRGVGATKLENDELKDLASEGSLDMEGDSEEVARLKAQIEALQADDGE